MKKHVILIGIILVLIALSLHAAEEMPDFSLQDLNGETVNLYETLEEGIVIVDFWATWCKPCCMELPYLDELHNKYDNVHVFAITVDSPKMESRVKQFVKSKKFSFITLLDPKSEVKKLLNVFAIPVTFIVGQNGEILYKHIGYKKGDEKHLEEELVQILHASSEVEADMDTQEEK